MERPVELVLHEVPSKPRIHLNRAIGPFIVPVLLLLAWELSVRGSLVPNTLIASPTQVVADFIRMCGNGVLFLHVGVSLLRLLAGFAIGSFSGILIGTLVGASRLASRLVEPTILGLIPVPAIAWIPLLIIFLGIGEASKILLIAIGSFAMLFVHTSYAIRSTDKSLVEVSQVLEKRHTTLIFRILLPSALPTIFASLRVALALSWGLVIAAELIASSKGIGWLIWDSRNFSRPDDMLVGMITAGVLGKISDVLLSHLADYMTRWRRTYGGIQDA
jgi:ABC-type nitrate/sulfonate/bicarbonate transport system permease component